MIHSLPELLRRRADELGDHPALRFKVDGTWHDVGYREYHHRVLRKASELIADGVEAGDRVGLLGPNSVEWLVTDLAIQSVGAVTVALHVGQSSREIEEQLRFVGAKVLIRTPSVSERGSSETRRHSTEPRSLTLGVRIATILFTSGTTGSPKGVMLTQSNLLSNAMSAQSVLPWGRDSVMLNFLPFSHIYARTSDAYQALVAGATLALAESPDAMPQNLLELRPNYVRGVPRFYEKMLAIGSQLHERFGGRIRWLFVGGAGLPERVAHQYQAAGLTLLQGYGLTETSPTITVNRPDRFRIGTVGVPLPGYEVRIADDGEILTRGPHVMAGYWNDSSPIIDGWFHTGDLGSIDDGFLTVTGRKKEMIVLSTGRKIVPFRIESRLQALPAVEHAIVVGEGRPHLVALISPRSGPISQSSIDEALSDLPSWERVRRFAILPRRLSVESGELTITQKVRREVVLSHFADIVEKLYSQ